MANRRLRQLVGREGLLRHPSKIKMAVRTPLLSYIHIAKPGTTTLTKFNFSLVTGVNAATMCISRNLALMFNTDKQIVAPTRGMRRRKLWTDIAICFGIPVLQAVLHYIIQVNRYYVQVIGGCTPSFDNSWPTIVIMYIWPMLFCFGNCYYSGTPFFSSSSDISGSQVSLWAN